MRSVQPAVHLGCLLAGAVIGLGAPSAAQAIEKIGSEFRINVNLTGDQGVPDVASDSAGNFVVVWQDGSNPLDNSNNGVFARRFNTGGSPLDVEGSPGVSEFKVPSATLNDQSNTEVARDQDGDFVVVWQSQNQDVNGGYAVYGKRFNAQGVAQDVPGSPGTTEFILHTTTSNDTYRNADVAMDASGNFVVVWDSTVAGGGNENFDIYARRFDAQGNPVGGEFVVNSGTTGNQILPAVALDAQGNIIVTWQSATGDGSGTGIFARIFDSTDAALGNDFQVNSTTTGDQTNPAIAVDAAGKFTVLWQSGDGSGQGIFAKRFDATGVALETPELSGLTEFRLNSTTANDQSMPSLDMSIDGSFVAVWQSFNQSADNDNFGVFARAFDAEGEAVSGELQANTYTTGDQKLPSVALDGVGNFVVVWESPQDTNGTGVYAQRFGLGLDAFSCYNGRESAGEPAFITEQVQLEDRFDPDGEPRTVTVKKPASFCNRAEVNGSGLFNDDANLTCFTIRGENSASSVLAELLPSQRTVRVSSAFGSRDYLVSKASQLCVPSRLLELNGVATTHLDPTELDHFNCYAVRNAPGQSSSFVPQRDVTVVDEITPEGVELNVVRPRMLCNPVEKTHGAVVTPIANAEAHLMCYEAQPSSLMQVLGRVNASLRTDNQFYDGSPNPEDIGLKLRRRGLLCMPSRMVDITP